MRRTIRLPDSTDQAIEEVSQSRGRTPSAQIREWIEQALRRAGKTDIETVTNKGRPKMKVPFCPRCGRKKAVQPQGLAGDMFRCSACGAIFDIDPDEGGDYSDRDPSARIERQERRAKKGKGKR